MSSGSPTNNSADAQDELSSIQETNQTAGMITLFAPDTVNARKEIEHIDWTTDGERDLNANPITALPISVNLSVYDGYWVYSTGTRTLSKQLK